MVDHSGEQTQKTLTYIIRHVIISKKQEVITMTDIRSSAAALYDGGWRAEVRDELVSEYNLTAKEADEICEMLASFAGSFTPNTNADIDADK
jgi:hypothetical protein